MTVGRAQVIARTESGTAMNYSSYEGATQTGLKLNKRWLSSRDEDVRTYPNSQFDHLRADGETVPLEAKFYKTGEALDYPMDSAGSIGNIVNCRCAKRLINR